MNPKKNLLVCDSLNKETYYLYKIDVVFLQLPTYTPKIQNKLKLNTLNTFIDHFFGSKIGLVSKKILRYIIIVPKKVQKFAPFFAHGSVIRILILINPPVNLSEILTPCFLGLFYIIFTALAIDFLAFPEKLLFQILALNLFVLLSLCRVR